MCVKARGKTIFLQRKRVGLKGLNERGKKGRERETEEKGHRKERDRGRGERKRMKEEWERGKEKN